MCIRDSALGAVDDGLAIPVADGRAADAQAGLAANALVLVYRERRVVLDILQQLYLIHILQGTCNSCQS